MKNRILSLAALLVAASPYTQAQNDDIYFDGTEVANNVVYKRYIDKSDAKADSYGSDEYVDEATDYDYQYASRIRRFNQPAQGFNYYSNYYVDSYWYNQQQFGQNIYMGNNYYSPYYGYNSNSNWGWNNGWNNGWCFNNGYNNFGNNGFGNNYYGGGYNPYNGYYDPFGYNSYGGGYGYNPYMAGYNNGYYNGYQTGWNSGWWSNGFSNNFNSFSAPEAANFITSRYVRSSDATDNRGGTGRFNTDDNSNGGGSGYNPYDTDQPVRSGRTATDNTTNTTTRWTDDRGNLNTDNNGIADPNPTRSGSTIGTTTTTTTTTNTLPSRTTDVNTTRTNTHTYPSNTNTTTNSWNTTRSSGSSDNTRTNSSSFDNNRSSSFDNSRSSDTNSSTRSGSGGGTNSSSSRGGRGGF